jgi:hypothetical protein
MEARALRHALAAAALAAAAPLASADTEAAQCELPDSGADPMADRAGLLAQYERVPHACLQSVFTACNAASSRALLDFGSAATCSLAYEALLSQRFNGNFRELMAWWRTQQPKAAQ